MRNEEQRRRDDLISSLDARWRREHTMASTELVSGTKFIPC